MLLAVGVIAASAFIQNPGCWSQVRATEQAQRGRSALRRKPSPTSERKTEDNL